VLRRAQPEIDPRIPATDGLGTLDLLFVGGTHGPNLQGLSRFVADCFLPFLAPAGVRLVVAGRVGPALWPGGEAPAGVLVLGRVGDLAPLYAAARLVIAPLIGGSGVSLKTLEAASFGKALLASTVGLRGTGAALGIGLEPPFDRRWAERIGTLLASRDERRRLRDRLAAALDQSSLGRVIDTTIAEMLGGRWRNVEKEKRAPAGGPLSEWLPGLEQVLDAARRGVLGSGDGVARLAAVLTAAGHQDHEYCLDVVQELADTGHGTAEREASA
jgi:hypothetical protein